jgi:hypothetical protein
MIINIRYIKRKWEEVVSEESLISGLRIGVEDTLDPAIVIEEKDC